MSASSIVRAALLAMTTGLTMTVDCGFAETDGSKPNMDLNLPTETPHSLGTPFGSTQADCIQSGGTFGVNSLGVKVCAKKTNALLGGDLIAVKMPSRAIEVGRKHCALYRTQGERWHTRYEYGAWTVWKGNRTRGCRAVITVVTNDGRTPKECGHPICPVPPPINVIPH